MMKKGCFIKLIITLTIVTAVILYIINNKFNDFIFNPGKRFIVNQIDKHLEYVKDSPEKDSLKLMIRNYVMGIKKIDSISNKQVDVFVDSLVFDLKDSSIDRNEFKSLSDILKRNSYPKGREQR